MFNEMCTQVELSSSVTHQAMRETVHAYVSACRCVTVLVRLSVHSVKKRGRVGGGGRREVFLSGVSPAVVHCSGLPAWRLAQLGLADSMPPQ